MYDMENEFKEITASLVEVLVTEDLTSLAINAADSLSGLPVFSTLSSLRKAGLSIRDRLFEKKLINFLLDIKEISANDRQEFIAELDNPQYVQRAGETLLILIDRFDHLKKPRLLANLVKAKISAQIGMDDFLRLSNVIDKTNFNDLMKLHEYQTEKIFSGCATEILFSTGLLIETTVDLNSRKNNRYILSELGQNIYQHGIAIGNEH
jgi:hypothetical protein